MYGTRPDVCRTFYCAWRELESLGDGWRPDKSGVLATIEPLPVTDPSLPAVGFCLLLTRSPLETVKQPWFVSFVREKALKGFPVFLGVYGPQGHRPLRVDFDVQDMKKAAKHSAYQIRHVLEQAVTFMLSQTFERDEFQHGGNDVNWPS